MLLVLAGSQKLIPLWMGSGSCMGQAGQPSLCHADSCHTGQGNCGALLPGLISGPAWGPCFAVDHVSANEDDQTA